MIRSFGASGTAPAATIVKSRNPAATETSPGVVESGETMIGLYVVSPAETGSNAMRGWFVTRPPCELMMRSVAMAFDAYLGGGQRKRFSRTI